MKVDVIVNISGVSRYDFTDEDSGEKITGCKLMYNIDLNDNDRLGSKQVSLNSDYKTFELFKGCSFPCKAKLTLDLTDLSKKPTLLDVSLVR